MPRVRMASVLATAAFSLGVLAGTLDLAVRDRAPEYTIVHAADASPSVKYAARELRDFTERMTGVRLPIATNSAPGQKAVVLAALQCFDLGEDGFRLNSAGGSLIVEGGCRGVLYGVYELLEKFGGCRWYASWHTVVPKRDAFSVPDDLDDAQKPSFPHREPFWWDMFNGDFAARNRANGCSMKLGPKHGGAAGRFGKGLGSCHTFAHLLPTEKYFDEHPEYFSMVKGKRIKDHPQLCLTNPDVLRIVTSNVLEHIRKDPTADYYGVSQNDWNNYCECPECAAVDAEEESHAGTMIRFVNAIAEAVEKEFPDKIIETLAYTYTRKPPKKTKLRHNVMPCLCTVECDMSRPLTESRYVQNVKFVDDIRIWHEQATRLYLWDYVTDFHALPHPFPDVYALQGNVQFFRDNGVYALFAQGNRHGCHAGFAELKAWLLAKWMWNPDLPMKPLLDDFFAGFYGAGAPFVREYFEELHRLQIAYTSADTNRWLNCHQNIPCPDIPFDFWDRAEKLLEQAAAAVKGDKTLEFNVRTVLFGVDFVRIETLRKAGGTVADLSDAGTARESLARQRFLVNRALAFMDEAKNVRLRSSAKKNDEMLGEWRKIADGTIAARADGVVEDCFLKLQRLGKGNERVDDPLAEDGHAVKLTDTEPHWTIQFPMTGVTFERGRRYALRMRLRADLVPERKGQAITVGIYDPKTKKYGCNCAYRAEQLSGDYAWYDVGDFDPAELSDRAYIYVGDGYLDKEGNRCANALYLDKFQFRADGTRFAPLTPSAAAAEQLLHRNKPKSKAFADRFIPTYPSVCDVKNATAREAASCLRGAVMYQLFTRMFTPEGTFKAAEQKLPELKELGVDIIYLTPHQLADDDPDPRYWSARQKAVGFGNPKNPYRQKDFYAVDPEYGSSQDLKDFVAAAHRLGMKVMFDLVYFHCGPKAVFLGEHPDFIVRNADGTPRLGEWAFPEMDVSRRGVRDYLYANMEGFVKDYDVDGFRCDVADMLPVDFWEEGYLRCKALKPDIFMMCEGLKGDDQLQAFDLSYGFYTQWTMVEFLKGGQPASMLRTAWEAQRRDYPRNFHWMRCFENHDFANVVPGEDRKEKRYGTKINEAMIATCFLLDGVPMLYNGQEIADSSPHSIFSNRAHGGWHIDWTKADEPHAVRRRSLVKRLTALRHENPGLFDAPVTWLETSSPDRVFAFRRELPDCPLTLAVNISKEPADVRIDGEDVSLPPQSFVINRGR